MWSRGEALAGSPHTAVLYEKVQTSLLIQAGRGPVGVARDTWSLSALQGSEGVVYSSDSCWWNWTTHTYICVNWDIQDNVCPNLPIMYTVKTNLQYLCNLHDPPALERLACGSNVCFLVLKRLHRVQNEKVRALFQTRGRNVTLPLLTVCSLQLQMPKFHFVYHFW